MNNYQQIHSQRQIKYDYKENHRYILESKQIQTTTLFHGTKSSPNAIIKNPINGISYLTDNNETMTVGQYGKHFFRVITSNTINKEHNHLYYEDISDYLSHHNVILTDENIARKWKLKKEYLKNMLVCKTIDPVTNTGDCSYVFTQPPWSAHVQEKKQNQSCM
jgi:hypothetical protein